MTKLQLAIATWFLPEGYHIKKRPKPYHHKNKKPKKPAAQLEIPIKDSQLA